MYERWVAAYRNEPWGDDWTQAAMIAAAVVSQYSKRRVSVEDFMPKFRRTITIMDADAVEKALLQAWGGK